MEHVNGVVARIQAIESRIGASAPAGDFDRVFAQATSGAGAQRVTKDAPAAGATTDRPRTLTLAQMLGRPVGTPDQTSPTTGAASAPAALAPAAATPATAGGTWHQPLEAAITSTFGPRTHPISGQRRPHLGMDLAAPTGTPIAAAAGGTVTHAGPMGGYGNVVIIDHGDGTESRYAHQHRVDVTVGQTVQGGQPVGTVGSTGNSTGPHLHFEIRRDGEAVDPAPLLGW